MQPYTNLSLDVAISALNQMKAINVQKRQNNQSPEEKEMLSAEFDRLSKEELIVLNQSKDIDLWNKIMEKIDMEYCPIIKAEYGA